MSRHRKSKTFQSVFISTIVYGLDALTLQDKHFKRIDAYCSRFLRRIVGITASYYSRITNKVVWRTAGYPKKPSSFVQLKMLKQVFLADPANLFAMLCSAPPLWIECMLQVDHAEAKFHSG